MEQNGGRKHRERHSWNRGTFGRQYENHVLWEVPEVNESDHSEDC